jgi:hypothetical protein
MAGSFFHLWLAEQALPMIFADGEPTDQMRAAFAAGAVGPDIGFFPGGPFAFSHRVHLEHCADFLRGLSDGAKSDVERAFVAGWGLHVYTDMAIHPWVEGEVVTLLDSGVMPAIPGLWHMRLEWGVDGRLLSQEGMETLWAPELHFPSRGDGSSLLGEVGAGFYGGDAGEGLLKSGAKATKRWLSRIPKILWWGGHAECRGQRLNPWCAFLFAGLGRKVVGARLQRWPYFKDAVALASPIKPTDEAWNRVVVLGDKALRSFCDGWQGGFAELGNMDLYRGEVADDRR